MTGRAPGGLLTVTPLFTTSSPTPPCEACGAPWLVRTTMVVPPEYRCLACGTVKGGPAWTF